MIFPLVLGEDAGEAFSVDLTRTCLTVASTHLQDGGSARSVFQALSHVRVFKRIPEPMLRHWFQALTTASVLLVRRIGAKYSRVPLCQHENLRVGTSVRHV